MPQGLRDMPRWRHADASWLDRLPDLVAARVEAWGLAVDRSMAPRHGSNALVVAVTRQGEPLVLRLAPPADDIAAEVEALRFWAGRGVVRLVDADVESGATLLERLDPSRSAATLPLSDAVPLLATMMRRLAVPPAATATSTGDLVERRLAELEAEWRGLDQPFDRSVLDVALEHGRTLARPATDLAVNADLHHDQVLAGTREPWLCVDPRMLRGDIEYDLGRVLWSRLDEMRQDSDIRAHLAAAVSAGGLDAERARSWVLFRTVDYWLWGLGAGFTDDPRRCARLFGALEVL